MAGLPVTVDLDAYRGDTFAQTFRFLFEDEPIDLTGATVAAAAQAVNGDIVELVAEVTDLAGEVTIYGTEDLGAGFYQYDVEVTTADTEVTTWVCGRLRVRQDVTSRA